MRIAFKIKESSIFLQSKGTISQANDPLSEIINNEKLQKHWFCQRSVRKIPEKVGY